MSEPRDCPHCHRPTRFIRCDYPMWIHADGINCDDGEPERHGSWVPRHDCDYNHPDAPRKD